MDSYKLVIEEIENRAKSVSDQKIQKTLKELIAVFNEMEQRQIASSEVNKQLKQLKQFLLADLRNSQLLRLKLDIQEYLRKQYKLVPPNYYRNLWMVLGMSLFGMPFGIMFGLTLDNMAFLGLGLPMGMPIGMAVGSGKDKKAAAEGLVIQSLAQTV